MYLSEQLFAAAPAIEHDSAENDCNTSVRQDPGHDTHELRQQSGCTQQIQQHLGQGVQQMLEEEFPNGIQQMLEEEFPNGIQQMLEEFPSGSGDLEHILQRELIQYELQQQDLMQGPTGLQHSLTQHEFWKRPPLGVNHMLVQDSPGYRDP